jgi:hypothetical protein
VLEPISRAQAEALGFDVAAQIAWLAEPHRSTLSWNPASCAGVGAECSDTGVRLSVQVTDVLLLQRSYRRPGGSCPSAPTQHLEYRGAVHLETDDAQLAGTFYARLSPVGAETEGDRFVGSAMPDLRNFSGSLPLRLELERAHFAYLYVNFALSRDGETEGFFEPGVQYYDAARGGALISADASWNGGRAFVSEPVPSGTATTLSDYPGSRLPPLVELSVRADAVDPAVDVSVRVSIGDRVVRDASVPAGAYIDLGAQPFGTHVSVDVRNPNAAGIVRANILQDNCFVASSSCMQPDCTAHAEYIANVNQCTN